MLEIGVSCIDDRIHFFSRDITPDKLETLSGLQILFSDNLVHLTSPRL
jgi:hypothetical protein